LLLRLIYTHFPYTTLFRSSHTGDRHQVERLADGIPIFLGQQHSIASLARDEDGLMSLPGLVDQGIQLRSSFCSIECGHTRPPFPQSVRLCVRFVKVPTKTILRQTWPPTPELQCA